MHPIPSHPNPSSDSAKPQAARETWGSKTGFLFAAIGSAVGLGNMWRFSYMAAEHGGAAFVGLYLVMTALLGAPILLGELSFGRHTRRGVVSAFRTHGGRYFRWLGWVPLAGAFLILAYYCVIAGWTLRYALECMFTGFPADPAKHFTEVSTGPVAVLLQLSFLLLTAFVVLGGVQRGIERASVILMPLLFLMVIGLVLYTGQLPGAKEGYKAYLFSGGFDDLFSLKVMVHAAGQAFFSVGLAMGCMHTFASYLGPNEPLARHTAVIASADFGVAFFSGLIVFPLIFTFGLQSAVGESSIGALFITLPEAFSGMGVAGRAVGTVFFLVLLVGALTSAISLLEVVTSSAMDLFSWSRKKAAWIGGAAVGLAGVPAALNLQTLDWMDRVTGNLVLLVAAIGTSLFIGWSMPDAIGVARQQGASKRWQSGDMLWRAWRFLLRFPAPIGLLILLASSLWEFVHP